MPIAVDHFTRTYGTFTAVDDLSFEVGSGEIVGLIGPNGAGKTTTLRALAGILRPTSGRIAIDGHDLATDSIEAKRRLAFMPDEPHLFEYLTVDEHLRLTARLYAVADFDARARTLIEELELAGKERSLPGELSRGMRQKVVIACGLVRDASVLLFDEPLTGLDPIGIRKMRADDRRARTRRARRSWCRRICCTSSRKSARAWSSWIAARRWPMAPSPSLPLAPKRPPDRTSSRSS